MKARIGFVSNSSSSSYLVLAAEVDGDMAAKIVGLAGGEASWTQGDANSDEFDPEEYDEFNDALEALELEYDDGYVTRDLMYVSDEGSTEEELSLKSLGEAIEEFRKSLGDLPYGKVVVRLSYSGC